MTFMTTVFIACSDKDSPPEGSNNNYGTEVTGDYTATTSVKTVTLEHEVISSSSNYYTSRSKIIYEDFNCSYDLLYSKNFGIIITPYERLQGIWKCMMSLDKGMQLYSKGSKCYIILQSIGKINNLSDITLKNIAVEPGSRSHCNAEIQPQFGYAGYFLTENGEKKYIRLHVKDYELNNTGALISITVEYQLY